MKKLGILRRDLVDNDTHAIKAQSAAVGKAMPN
jgi:hypothetical protein